MALIDQLKPFVLRLYDIDEVGESIAVMAVPLEKVEEVSTSLESEIQKKIQKAKSEWGRVAHSINESQKAEMKREIQKLKAELSDSTLMRYSKKQLIELLREAEHNRDVAIETLEQQYQNVKDWKPATHAHWKIKEQKVNAYGGTCIVYYAICSKCGGRITYGSFPPEYADKEKVAKIINRRYKYCLRCGAKMDEEEGNTDEN